MFIISKEPFNRYSHFTLMHCALIIGQFESNADLRHLNQSIPSPCSFITLHIRKNNSITSNDVVSVRCSLDAGGGEGEGD